MIRKIKMILYISLFMLIISLPFYGMLFYKKHENTENKRLKEMPKVKTEEGKYNLNYLTELSDYLSDNFAFRQELVTASAVVNEKLFATSSEDMIVTGTNGWLYYSNTLPDYQGNREYTKRSIYCIKKNIELMDEYARSLGGNFILTVPPNKNSLYSENMPYYYKKISDKTMAKDLKESLAGTEVKYVDLFEIFISYDEILYHKTDSHWNNKGAAIVHDKLMEKTGKTYTSMEDKEAKVVDNFEGDLDKIYYPLIRHYEKDYSYEEYFEFSYLNDHSDTTYFHLETENENKDGRLLMFRDSFGNTLTPFMANEYNYAIFEKTVPYRIDYMEEYEMDTCIFEMVERNLKTLLSYSAVFDAPERRLLDFEINTIDITENNSADTYVNAETYMNYIKLSGEICKDYISDESDIFIMTKVDGEEKVYEASLADCYGSDEEGYDNGFTMYIKSDKLPEKSLDVKVFVKDDSKINIVFDGNVSYSE